MSPPKRKPSDDVEKLFSDMQNNIGLESFLTSRTTEPSHYIDTGSMALNRILSGDLYGGIPSGRVVVIGGENSSGKSLISAQIAVNALTKCEYTAVVLFDSEGGILKNFFVTSGVDMNKVRYMLVSSVEECSVKMNQLLQMLMEYKEGHPEAKFLIILDSLGNLNSDKFYKDIDKNKQVGDQGLRAKSVNQFVKSITVPALKADVPIIILNHVYFSPNDQTRIMKQGGGEGSKYIATINVQTTKKFFYDPKDLNRTEKAKTGEQYYKGNVLTFFTVKNRLVKPFHEADIFLDFTSGMSKYDGLLDLAVKYGFVDMNGSWYKVPTFSDKSLRREEVMRDEVWNTFIQQMNERCKKEMSYSAGDKIVPEEADDSSVADVQDGSGVEAAGDGAEASAEAN